VKGFLLCDQGTVLKEWLDGNGHMNVTAYMALFDKGTNILLESCGIGTPNTDFAMVASRIMIDHRREFIFGNEWQLWSGVISATSTYVTLTHRLRSKKSVHAVCDIRGAPLSMVTRQSTYIGEEMVSRLSQYVVQGLVDRFDAVTM
jgi:acyl-CoA thioesterase FadM